MDYLDIELQASNNQMVTLRDFKRKKLILYFYPKDNTSGCTLEALDFTRHKKAFENLGYNVIGVSKDSFKSHCNFIEKHSLTILLLSDPEQKLIEAFDVIKEKQMYGKHYMGIERSTFVLNEHGSIEKTYRNVKAKDHVETLLQDLKA